MLTLIAFAVIGLVLAIERSECYFAKNAYRSMNGNIALFKAVKHRNCCGSNGIACKFGKIISIDWSSLSLYGEVSSRLAQLKFLEVL